MPQKRPPTTRKNAPARPPPPVPRMQWDYATRDHPMACLQWLAANFGDHNELRDGDVLTHNQRQVYCNLVDWFERDLPIVAGKLGDCRLLDVARLLNDFNLRPRVDFELDITSKDNLILRWAPRDFRYAIPQFNSTGQSLTDRFRFNSSPDYLDFEDSDALYANQRPERELMFIRGVGNLNLRYRDNPRRTAIDEALIGAVVGAVATLQQSLAHMFDIQPLGWFELELEPAPVDEVIGRSISSYITGWNLKRAPYERPPRPQPEGGGSAGVLPFRRPASPDDEE